MNRNKLLISSVLILLLGFVFTLQFSARGGSEVQFPIQASVNKLFSLTESFAVADNPHPERSSAVAVLGKIIERGLHEAKDEGKIKAEVSKEISSQLMSDLGSFQSGAASGKEFARQIGILGKKVKRVAPQCVVVILEETALGKALIDNSGLLSTRPGNLTDEEVSSLVRSVSANVKAGLPSVASQEGKTKLAAGPEDEGGASLFQGKWKDPNQNVLRGKEKKKDK